MRTLIGTLALLMVVVTADGQEQQVTVTGAIETGLVSQSLQEGCLWRCQLHHQICQSVIADACFYDVCVVECADPSSPECEACWTGCYYPNQTQCRDEYAACINGCFDERRW